MRTAQNIERREWTILLILVSLIFVTWTEVYAKPQPYRSSLTHKENMYTGKKLWIYNYRFFPEVRPELLDSSVDYIPHDFYKHRIEMYAEGGYAGFLKNKSAAVFNPKFGIGIGMNYCRYFNWRSGIKTGLSLVTSKSTGDISQFEDRYTVTDDEMDDVTYNYKVGDVHEDYGHWQLDIPIEYTMRFKQFNFGLGLKLGLPLCVKFNQKVTSIEQTAFYEKYDVFVDDSWTLGCGKFNEMSSDSKFTQSPMFIMATFDMQYIIKIGQNMGIGIGVFADQAFVGISPKYTHNKKYNNDNSYKQHTLISVTKDIPASVYPESLLSSKEGKTGKRIVSGMLYTNLGLRVSFIFEKELDRK